MIDKNLQIDLTMAAEIDLYYDVFIPENIAKLAPLLIAVLEASRKPAVSR